MRVFISFIGQFVKNHPNWTKAIAIWAVLTVLCVKYPYFNFYLTAILYYLMASVVIFVAWSIYYIQTPYQKTELTPISQFLVDTLKEKLGRGARGGLGGSPPIN